MGEEAPESAPLEFRLFGAFEARRYGQPIAGLHKRKGERILAYLALRAGQWVETRKLASEFWSDIPTDDPASNLRQSLKYVRHILDTEAHCLQSRIGAVRLELREVQADTLRFEAACKRGDPPSLAMAHRMSEETLLAGWDDAWIVPFREGYERKLRTALARVQEGSPVLPTRQSERPTTTALLKTVLPQEAPSGPTGGTVPLGSSFYIERDADQTLFGALVRQESIVLIKGAQQTGKSSLLARGLQFARQAERIVYHIDCEQFAPEDLNSRDNFSLRLLALLAEQADQEFAPETDWKPHLGANGNMERFLRRRILAHTQAPVLWALDGVDRLFKTTYYNEFFALLRGLHTRRATEPEIPWNRLTVLIAAATEAHLYIRDLSQSPFNVGARINLEDFEEDQTADLQKRYGLPMWADVEQQRLRDLLGGHPYLLARGLQEIRERNLDVLSFTELAARTDGPYRDHLEGMLRLLSADDGLRTDLRAVLEGRPCSEIGFFRLRSAGVVVGDSVEEARPRCGLYARYFTRRLP
jgi:hypothetical protein